MKKLALILLLVASRAFAADLYITDNTSGGDTGADCENAHSAAWFNDNAVGGNTYHLCGTFTGTANSTKLTVPASGSAGNLVTIIFETGAAMTAPYWSANGAIYVNGKNYVTIDGGNVGTIQNSANGTAQANQQTSNGVRIAGASNVTIRRLTIKDIYLNGGSSQAATDTAGVSTNDIYVTGNSSGITIDNNTLLSSRTGARIDFSTDSDITISNNYIADHCWGIAVATSSGSPGDTATNTLIHNNTITDWANWQCPANAAYCNNKTDTYHTDGIILFAARGGPVFTPKIYSNYIYGDLGNASATAFVFCTYGGGTSGTATSCSIYNNLLIGTNATRNPALIWIGGSNDNTLIYNNTVIGASTSTGTLIALGSTVTGGALIKNNIIENGRVAIAATDVVLSTALAASSNNVFNNINTGTSSSMFSQNDGANWYTWAQWQGLGYDTSGSMYADPSLDASYIPQAGSVAIDNGTDLSASFTTDYAGNTRSGTWDIGAYEYDATDSTPNVFSFSNVTNAALSTETTTNPCMTVAGIDAGQTPAISISGAGCTYNVDGGAYTADAGTVGLDNVVCLRVTSSGSYSTTLSCTPTIGGVSDTWTVRTLDAVSDPVAPRMRAGSMSGGWR